MTTGHDSRESKVTAKHWEPVPPEDRTSDTDPDIEDVSDSYSGAGYGDAGYRGAEDTADVENTTGTSDTLGGRDASADEDELAPEGSPAARDTATTSEDVMAPGGTKAQTGAYAPSPRPAADAADMVSADSGPMLRGEEDLQASWQRIQASFVDDPRASVTEAAALVEEAAETVVATIQERERSLRGSWEGNGNGTDTEKLRTALREYREFYQKISQI